jgi:hypothetical protein
MVSGAISPPYSGYFSPFLHSTCTLSVSQEYLALPDGAGCFKRGVSDPALLRILLISTILPLRGFHPLRLTFPGNSCSLLILNAVLLPQSGLNHFDLGFSHFARHYFGNHCCFLFLQVIRCFSSLGWLPLQDVQSSTGQVVPFGYLRIKPYLQVPVAFRSLSRPSSPLRA